MNSKKLYSFDISDREHKVIMWAISLFVGLNFVAMLPEFITLSGVTDGASLPGFRHLIGSSVGKMLLAIFSTGSLVVVWELIRRQLSVSKSMLSYVVLAIITLVIMGFLKDIPNGTSVVDSLNQPVELSVTHRIGIVSGYLLNIILFLFGIVLAITTRGRLRALGLSLFLCPIVGGTLDVAYISAYSANLLTGAGAVPCIVSVLKWILNVLPIIFLGRTMKVGGGHLE